MTLKFRRSILPKQAGLPRSGTSGSKPQIDTRAGAGKNKFGAQRAEVEGVSFDSKKEARRWGELSMLQRAGEIRNLKRQVKIELQGRDGPLRTRTGRPMILTVDFTYEDRRAGWALVYEDAKGAITRDYEVRRAVAQAMGITVVET